MDGDAKAAPKSATPLESVRSRLDAEVQALHDTIDSVNVHLSSVLCETAPCDVADTAGSLGTTATVQHLDAIADGVSRARWRLLNLLERCEV